LGKVQYFYINDGAEFARRTETGLVEERVFFTDARKIVDDKKRAILLHLKIK
jgi:hypothetical protein